jgi:hypothetical protein
MLDLTDGRDVFIAKSDTFEAILSKRKGGSMTGLSFNGINTGLRREGCEYWIDNRTHYEQEFGSLLSFHAVKKSETEISVNVKSTLVSPQKKEYGGEGNVEWTFCADGRIITKSQINPIFDPINYDKYVCFFPDSYSHFSFCNDREDVEILKPKPGTVEWFCTRADMGGIIIKNKKQAFEYSFDNKLYDCGIYTTKNMIEIKCKDHRPRFGQFSEMAIRAI